MLTAYSITRLSFRAPGRRDGKGVRVARQRRWDGMAVLNNVALLTCPKWCTVAALEFGRKGWDMSSGGRGASLAYLSWALSVGNKEMVVSGLLDLVCDENLSGELDLLE